MPGSSFKPLYYSAAMDSRQFTPASLIYDLPIVFHNEDGTPYLPLNFRGEWKGPVLLYNALANSMNVPSLKILDAIGFDAAIDRAADLLMVYDPAAKRRTFPRLYPMGLGTISVAPIQIARAYAVFANRGQDVTPIAIRTIEDRNGRIIMDPERELRVKQRRMGTDIQVISPQNAYVMTGLLKKTLDVGTLASVSGKFVFRDEDGARYHIPAAGKTGTTQNWSDAWAVGFTPYYTTAIWFGFDKPGNSLGLSLTGATLAGPIWGDYLREIHLGLPAKDFIRPAGGLVDVTVCTHSGLLKTSSCPSGVTLTFLEGTQPAVYCDVHENTPVTVIASRGLNFNTIGIDDAAVLQDLRMPELDIDFLPSSGTQGQDHRALTAMPQNQRKQSASRDKVGGYGLELPSYNPLLD
jgi:penicillin-binding protein 1A